MQAVAPIIIANTYHLYLRTGEKVVHMLGGIQKMMEWNKPVLTDSGGFQVFSLGEQMKRKTPFQKKAIETGFIGNDLTPAKITEKGVEFTSHLDGTKHFFTPQKAIQIQQRLGADIIMAFDECTSDTATEKETRAALEKTLRWAKQCKDEWERHDRMSAQGTYQALFGIIQGAMDEGMRKEGAQAIVDLNVDGIAFGGETIGYNMPGTVQVIDWVRSLLPEDKPRYAMGLGKDPQDILDAINP